MQNISDEDFKLFLQFPYNTAVITINSVQNKFKLKTDFPFFSTQFFLHSFCFPIWKLVSLKFQQPLKSFLTLFQFLKFSLKYCNSFSSTSFHR